MSTDLAVIEAALKAATESPWFVDAPDRVFVGNRADGRSAGLFEIIYGSDDVLSDLHSAAAVRALANAHLIANAPTWLAELVERVKVAEAEVKRVREAAHTLGKIIDNQCRDVLDITGAHDLIDADGDGDWGVIWDLLREQAQKGQRAEAAEAAIERVRAAVERAETRGGGYAGILHGSEILRALDGDA